MPRKMASVKNANPSSENGIPMIAPANRMNSGQSRPSSNDSTVPDTAPTAKRIAVPRAHRLARSRWMGSPERRQRRSATTMRTGIAIPTTAKTMWKASDIPIWTRAAARSDMSLPAELREAVLDPLELREPRDEAAQHRTRRIGLTRRGPGISREHAAPDREARVVLREVQRSQRGERAVRVVSVAQHGLHPHQRDGRVAGGAASQLLDQRRGPGRLVPRAIHHRLLVQTRREQTADVRRVPSAQTGTARVGVDQLPTLLPGLEHRIASHQPDQRRRHLGPAPQHGLDP